MPAHMKTRHTNANAVVDFTWRGARYIVPVRFIEKYRVPTSDTLSITQVFGDLIKEHGEPAVLLKGLRTKEAMTQTEFANVIGITQTNLSAMENGRRTIGKDIAKRIAEKFGVDYRIFL